MPDRKKGGRTLRTIVLALLVVALAYSGSGCGPINPLSKPLARISPVDVVFEGTNVGGLAEDDVRNLLMSIASQNYLPAHNAGFDDTSGSVVAEKPGRLLDVPGSLAHIMEAEPGANLPGLYHELAPSLTVAELAKGQIVASYATRISDFSPEAPRVKNIRLALQLINNAYIEPGSEFSFNNRVGEPTAERGFKPARIFGDNGQDTGIGGGICQVSTTLYNAVIAAGLTVTERHPHSQPVEYVPAGQDATTYTDKDLRFVNSRRRSIIIRALQPADKVVVDFFELPRAPLADSSGQSQEGK